MDRLHGVHCVREALRARRRKPHRLLVRAGRLRPELDELVRLARTWGVRVEEVEARDLVAEPGPGASNPQGVALEAEPLPELELADLILAASQGCGRGRRIVALDGVEDPQNVGAIVRVAEASGVAGLVLTQRRAPPLSPALARASAGAVEWLPVARVTNLGRALKCLKSEGFWVVGADPEATASVFEVEPRVLRGDLVVVLGAEGRGLRPGVASLVDHPVRIPMQGRVGSLNVSAASAVLLYELMRRSGLEFSAGVADR